MVLVGPERLHGSWYPLLVHREDHLSKGLRLEGLKTSPQERMGEKKRDLTMLKGNNWRKRVHPQE